MATARKSHNAMFYSGAKLLFTSDGQTSHQESISNSMTSSQHDYLPANTSNVIRYAQPDGDKRSDVKVIKFDIENFESSGLIEMGNESSMDINLRDGKLGISADGQLNQITEEDEELRATQTRVSGTKDSQSSS